MSTNGNCVCSGVCSVMALCVCCGTVTLAYSFAGGTGEPNNPYQIATVEQLISIGSNTDLLDKHYVLLNDIDLDPNLPGGQIFARAVIAPTAGGKAVFWSGMPFTGSLDGRGHRICNLTIRADGAGHLGLFGYLGRQAVVTDLGIADADAADGDWACGAIAGTNEGRISRCYAQSCVSAGSFVGGLVGYNNGEIVDCWAEGEVTAGESVGGLVGENWDGTIRNSHASSRVVSRYTTIAGRDIGGLAGKNWGEIVNCYASGDVSALTLMQAGGGLVGSNSGSVVNCHATGNVFATRGGNLGGLVGGNDGHIVHSYATGSVSGRTSAYGTRDGKPAGSQALGGLVGRQTSYGYIHACYASGNVSGGDRSGQLGGLVGSQWGDVVDSYCVGRVRAGANSTAVGGLAGSGGSGTRASFWDIEASGLAQSSGGVGLMTAQMQDAATFLAAGWDWVGERANGTVDPWFIPDSGGYPMLTFQSNAFQPHQLDGGGTANDPYRITTAEDLGAINHYNLTGCYRLEADLNLAAITWKESPIRYFGGRFDGAGKTVFNLEVRGMTHVGLFGTLGQNASVVNLGICDANIMGRSVLGMWASVNKGRIVACRADGKVGDRGIAGGLIGWNEGSISDSYTIGMVTARTSLGAGGLTGRNFGSIRRCYATVYVTGTGYMTGYENAIGGLVGTDSYLDKTGQTHDSFFLMAPDGGGPDNGFGVPLTNVQMKQQASFINWDFESTWIICEGRDYPRLRWEKVDCDRP